MTAAYRTDFLLNVNFLLDDFPGMFYTVFTNVTVLPGNQNFNLFPAAAAERAMKW